MNEDADATARSISAPKPHTSNRCRRWWAISIGTLLGLAGAAAIVNFHTPVFQSEAVLLVRPPSPIADQITGADARGIKLPGETDETITPDVLVALLGSLDLAADVARTLGPEQILPSNDGNQNPSMAANFIRRNLTVLPSSSGRILRVEFKHPNPGVAQSVLKVVIEVLLRRQVALSSPKLWLDYLAQMRDRSVAELARIQEERRRIVLDAGATSVEDEGKFLASRGTKLRDVLIELEMDLAAAKAIVQERNKHLADTSKEGKKRAEQPSAGSQLADDQSQDRLNSALSRAPSDDRIKVVALEAKKRVLTSQLDAIQQQAIRLRELSSTATELERTEDAARTELEQCQEALNSYRIVWMSGPSLSALGSQGFAVLSTPSPPEPRRTVTTRKALWSLLAGPIVGIALALLIGRTRSVLPANTPSCSGTQADQQDR